MEDKLHKVLVISSADPTVGPGVVGTEYFNALKRGGFDVDFMTKYPVEGHPEYISIIKKKPLPPRSIIQRIFNRIRLEISRRWLNQNPGFCFFYKKEKHPPVPVARVVNAINRQYDLVCVVFWQELLSFATIDALYDRLHCLFFFLCVDYSPMSGGCHFTGSCQRFQSGCGFCPGISSHRERDFTRWNVQCRKRVYDRVKPVVFGNSYMNSFYRKSYLLKDYDRLETGFPFIDNETFSPRDKIAYRSHYKIPDNKRFVIFFGSQDLDDPRKGFSYLLDALAIFYKQLTSAERESVILVLAGRNIDSIRERLCFDYLYLGYVNPTELPGIYSMSNVYLSPSINDAGPSMVNQAMSCGTPVVSFEIGTALDVIKDRGTGYCAKLRSSEDFATGVETIFRMSDSDYTSLRHHCREVALELTSEDAFINNIRRVFNKYSMI